MSLHRFFRRQSSLRSRARGLAFLCFILLISGCGGEESVDKPIVETVGDELRNEAVPISTIYYPMSLGSWWRYRNPDGSEWMRKVSDARQDEIHNYSQHVFNYNPPIRQNQFNFLKPPVYTEKPLLLCFWQKTMKLWIRCRMKSSTAKASFTTKILTV